MFKIIRDLRIDVIINENILNGLIGFLMSNSRVLKVFDFSDYFPESASIYYANSSPVKGKLVEMVTLAITKLNIMSANVCLAVCRSLMNVVRSIDDEKPCYLLTNGADMKALLNQTSEIKQQLRTKPAQGTILVMGVIDEWLDLETPIRALKILRKRFPVLKLVIVGPWRKEEHRRRIDRIIEEQGLTSNVRLTGYVSDQELAVLIEDSVFCVMPYKLDTFSAIIRLPEKLFMYSAHGKPILSTFLPEVAALRCRHIFFYNNIVEFVDAASFVLSQGEESDLSVFAKVFAEQHDTKLLAERLEKIMLESLSRKQ
jgi:glycosyltransferase involved in cell wall biosynthesis